MWWLLFSHWQKLFCLVVLKLWVLYLFHKLLIYKGPCGPEKWTWNSSRFHVKECGGSELMIFCTNLDGVLAVWLRFKFNARSSTEYWFNFKMGCSDESTHFKKRIKGEKMRESVAEAISLFESRIKSRRYTLSISHLDFMYFDVTWEICLYLSLDLNSLFS